MPASRNATEALLGNARSIVSLREQVARLAPFDTVGGPRVPTVLLCGETGTGKGLVARMIHESGPRAEGPFVDVNCGAIPETMLEAELFGFEAGAFTDAKRAKPGLFEAASGGTLFLDEIDSLAPGVQSKLLKAIEEKRIRRLGAVAAHVVDVKLITATQHDLGALVAASRFRADLYHRLALLVLSLPPLRTRQDDVVMLAEHFLQTFAEAHNLPAKRLDSSGSAWLRAYDWPGNVRELGHLMERVTLLGTGSTVDRATLETLSPRVGATVAVTQPTSGGAGDDDGEQIRLALARSGGNVVRAAAALGIGRNALRYRMRRLGIERDTLEALPLASAPTQHSSAATTARPPEWEQKPIAVLIIAVTFPAASGDAAYDAWTLASRWQRAIIDRIEGFGGHVTEQSHSRFVAVFGLPRALEQMSQRATHAALAIQRYAAHAPAPRPAIHAVLHAGEARIDTAAADPLAMLLPIADTFTLGDRLLGHAGAGELLISAAVARRIERSWNLHSRALSLGPRVEDRVTAYTLSPRQDANEKLESPRVSASAFVGRERELGLLQDAFARAARGSGQAVFIAGDAGIGKSRLVNELHALLAGTPHRWIEGRCAAYGKSIPFLPIIDGLRRHLRIDDEDDDDTAGQKITDELGRLGDDVGWTAPFIRQLLSLNVQDAIVRDLDSASRRSELFRALRAVTLRAADIEPLVLVVEDLHWIDWASEEYLAFVTDVIPTTRLLLILTHRPGYLQPFGDRSYFARVSLLPLGNDAVTTITNDILGSSNVPQEIRALIASKAEGNPFFAEELTKSLLEDGTLVRDNGSVSLTRQLDVLAVPDSIQDVLIARIDRLAEASRHAIQIAAVIGREFALRLLARITEVGDCIQTQVDELRGLELIYEKVLHPELAYMFKHALTHDVAYESVLNERRVALHRTIGHAIEELYADRLTEHYEILAHHFSRGEDWSRAIAYLERSADKAAQTYANRAVIEHCRQALAIAERMQPQVPETICRLYERIGLASAYLSHFGASAVAYERAAQHSTDPEAQALYLGSAAYNHFWNHDYAASQRCNREARELSQQQQIVAGEAMAVAVSGFYSGVHDADLIAYERDSRRAISLCATNPRPPIEALARFQLAQIAEWTGAYRDSLAMAEEVLVMGRALRLPDLIVFATWFLGKARCCLGDFGGALVQLDDAYHLCDRIGDRAWKSRLLNTMGWCFAEIGSVDRAQACNEHAAALARELGDPEILVNASVNLAMNALALGQIERAQVQLDPIEEMLAKSNDPWMRWRYTLHILHARGALALSRGRAEAALAVADDEWRKATEHRAPKIAARAQLLRAAALLTLDQRDDAETALAEVKTLADRIEHQRSRWEACRGLAAVAARRGKSHDAAHHLTAARTIVEESARTLADESVRQRLLDVLADAWLPTR